MNNKLNTTTDIIVLILSGIWLSELDFNNLSKLQIVGLLLFFTMLILMAIKFIKLRK